VISVLRPAEIVDSRSIEGIPAVLGVGLAVGAVAALGLTLPGRQRVPRDGVGQPRTYGDLGRHIGASAAEAAPTPPKRAAGRSAKPLVRPHPSQHLRAQPVECFVDSPIALPVRLVQRLVVSAGYLEHHLAEPAGDRREHHAVRPPDGRARRLPVIRSASVVRSPPEANRPTPRQHRARHEGQGCAERPHRRLQSGSPPSHTRDPVRGFRLLPVERAPGNALAKWVALLTSVPVCSSLCRQSCDGPGGRLPVQGLPAEIALRPVPEVTSWPHRKRT
jgi:hypothetical protein